MSDRPDEADTDRRLATVFHESGPDHAPDVADLVQGSIARGTIAGASVRRSPRSPPSASSASRRASYRPRRQRRRTRPGRSAEQHPGQTDQPGRDLEGRRQRGHSDAPATADIPVRAADLPGAFKKLYPGKITPAEERTGRIIDDGRQGQIANFRWTGFTTGVGFVAFDGTPAAACARFQNPEAGSASQHLNCKARPGGAVLMTSRDTAPERDGGGKAQGASLFTKDATRFSSSPTTRGRRKG